MNFIKDAVNWLRLFSFLYISRAPTYLVIKSDYMFIRRQKEKIDDPFFGSMELVDDESQYFGGSYFTPLQSKIEINIFSNSGGPTEKQRLLYREIEQRYFEYIEKVPSLIEEEFRKDRKGFTIRDFSKEFELTGITIPQLGETNVSWEFEYATTHQLDGWVTIKFIDWEAKRAYFVQ